MKSNIILTNWSWLVQ